MYLLTMMRLVFVFLYVVYNVCVNGLFFQGECSMTNLSARFDTCPQGSCCCSDPGTPNVHYCKPISGEGGPCYAKAVEWTGSCPCPDHMTCVPNLEVPTWTSTYGHCENKTV